MPSIKYDAPFIRQLLSNKEGAEHLHCADNTLKQSRVTGILFGVSAPAFIKMGHSVRYNLSTLDEWLAQFPEQKNTAQNTAQ